MDSKARRQYAGYLNDLVKDSPIVYLSEYGKSFKGVDKDFQLGGRCVAECVRRRDENGVRISIEEVEVDARFLLELEAMMSYLSIPHVLMTGEAGRAQKIAKAIKNYHPDTDIESF